LHGRAADFVADRATQAATMVQGYFRHGAQVLDPTNLRTEVEVPQGSHG
jgi:hypothetical protein